jgi:hypothetical protein
MSGTAIPCGLQQIERQLSCHDSIIRADAQAGGSYGIPERELGFDPARGGGRVAVRRRLLHGAERAVAQRHGQDDGAEQAGRSAVANAAPFVLAFVGEVIIAWAIYGILLHMNMFTLRGGVISAAVCWFGFVLPTVTVNYAFGGRRPMLIVLDSASWLGAMLIIGAIVGWLGP